MWQVTHMPNEYLNKKTQLQIKKKENNATISMKQHIEEI